MTDSDKTMRETTRRHLKLGRFTLGPGEIGPFIDVHDALLTEPNSMYVFARALYGILPRSIGLVTPAPSPISTILVGAVLSYEQTTCPNPRLSGRLYRGGSRSRRGPIDHQRPNGHAALLVDVAVTPAMILQQATALRSEGTMVTTVAALFLRSRILADHLRAYDLDLQYVLGPDEMEELLPAHLPANQEPCPTSREPRPLRLSAGPSRTDPADVIQSALEYAPRTLADEAYARHGLTRPRARVPSLGSE